MNPLFRAKEDCGKGQSPHNQSEPCCYNILFVSRTERRRDLVRLDAL